MNTGRLTIAHEKRGCEKEMQCTDVDASEAMFQKALQQSENLGFDITCLKRDMRSFNFHQTLDESTGIVTYLIKRVYEEGTDRVFDTLSQMPINFTSYDPS